MGGGGSIKLARVFGIRVGATPSWFVVLFVLIYLLTGHFRDVLAGSDAEAFWVAVAAALLFEASIVVHELGHAVVARRVGVEIEGIDLWFFGGLAKLSREPDTPRRELAVAAAGPALTLLVVVACVLAGLALGRIDDVSRAATLDGDRTSAALALLGWLAVINGIVFVFNLIPAYPLDGGRIALALGWWRTGSRTRGLRLAARTGQAFGYVVIGLGAFVALRGDTLDGVWFAVLGWFLLQSARQASASSAFSERLEGVTASDLMDPAPTTLPADTTVLHARDALTMWPFAAVADADGRFLGVLTQERAEEALAAGRPTLPLSELLEEADARGSRVAPQTPVQALLGSEPLRVLGVVMVVDEHDHLRGVVTTEQVRRALTAAAAGR